MVWNPYADEIRRQRQQLQALGVEPQAQAQGMTSPYVTQEDLAAGAASIAGQERAIKRQSDAAAQLRAKAAPQGKSVGPSGIYVGPNWGESLGYAAEQAFGGYMQGRANEADKALDAERSEAALAQARMAQANKERAFGHTEIGLQQAADRLEADAARDLRDFEYEAERDLVEDEHKRKDREIKAEYYEGLAERAGSGYRSDTRKEHQTWMDPYGNVKYTYVKGDEEFDRDTGEKVEPGWIKKGKWRETSLMNEGQETKYMAELEKRAGPVLELMDKVDRADEAAFPDKEKGENRFNWLTKQRNQLGGSARVLNDLMVEGAPEGEKFSAAMEVVNAITRLRVGLSQTITEQANVFLESGMDMLSEPGVFEAWWSRLSTELDDQLARIEATTNPRVLEMYQRNRERLDEEGSKLDDRHRGPPRKKKTILDYSDEDLEAMSTEDLEELAK